MLLEPELTMSASIKTTAVLAAIASLGMVAPASATVYFFHFQGDPSNASYGNVVIDGLFTTAEPVSAGPSAITAISGSVSGGSGLVVDGQITKLSPYASSDNILYNIGTTNDYSFGGVSFTATNSTQSADYNLFDQNGATFLLISTIDSTGYAASSTPAAPVPVSSQGTPLAPPTAVVGPQSAVPEPTSWALMLAGFGFAGGALRQMRRERIAVAA